MSTGLHVTSNDTYVVISRTSIGSSRFHNFYVSQLYMSLRDHMLSRRLCRVVKRPLQSFHW